jgi:hypothetical protein
MNLKYNLGALVVPACLAYGVVSILSMPVLHAQELKAPTPADTAAVDAVSSGENEGGRLPVRARLSISSVFDDNIFISSNNEESDFIWNISPGVSYETSDPTLNLEHFFTVSYDPTIVLFTDNTDQDALEHNAYAMYRYSSEKLTLSLDQRFLRLSGSTTDAGNRIDRDLYNTGLLVNYQVTGKSQIELEVGYDVADYDDVTKFDTNDIHFGLFWLYQIAPKLVLGLGPEFGWLDVENNPNQTYQRSTVRLRYEVSEKVSLTARAGMEFRQYQDLGTGDDETVTPVMSIQALYKPFDGTELSLDVYRRVEASSVLATQNYVNTGFAVTARQRVFQKYFLGLAGGFENSDYESTNNIIIANREDDYFFVRPSFDWEVTDWWTLTAFYEFRENDSNIANNQFTNNRAGVQTTFRY